MEKQRVIQDKFTNRLNGHDGARVLFFIPVRTPARRGPAVCRAQDSRSQEPYAPHTIAHDIRLVGFTPLS
jgi:hypothetical protein